MRLLSNGGGGGGGGVEDVECEGVGEGESARCLRGRRWVVEATAMAMRGAKCKVHQTAATGEMRCRRCGKQWRRCANNKLQVHARNEMSKALHCNGKAMGSLSPQLTWQPGLLGSALTLAVQRGRMGVAALSPLRPEGHPVTALAGLCCRSFGRSSGFRGLDAHRPGPGPGPVT